MTPSSEIAETIYIGNHEHIHSVYVRCKDCLTFGVPMPGEFQCGNCNSHNTISYSPACCIDQARKEAIAEAKAMSCDKDCGKEYRLGRKEAFERAAEIADHMELYTGVDVAQAIREEASK